MIHGKGGAVIKMYFGINKGVPLVKGGETGCL